MIQRSLTLPFLLVLSAAAPATPAPITTTLSTNAEAEGSWVPFTLTPGNQIRFTMQLEGRAVPAVLDTGVSTSVLSRRYAEANGFPVRDSGKADVIGGTVAVGTAATRSLAIGAMSRTGGALTVAAIPDAATGDGKVDVLVGRDLTAGWALDIDYPRRRFRLLPSGRLPFRGTSAALTIAPERQVYVSSVILGGAVLQPMVIDTGDGAAVTLSRRAWASAMMADAPATTTISYGVGGMVVNDVRILPRIVVGRTVAREVEVRVEPAGGFSDAIGVAGRVGSGFLQEYRVLLDPGAGHMMLAPASAIAASPDRSTSGLLLAAEPTRARVLHVMRGSPAASAGWQAGDAICAVDGSAIGPDYATSALAGWTAGKPGRRVALTMCDGARRELELRTFY